MDITTLLIIVVLIVLLGGGGWYGRTGLIELLLARRYSTPPKIRTVANDANEMIVKIDDLLVTRDGKKPYVVLSVAGFRGMGTRLVVIRYDNLLPGGTKEGPKMLPAFQYSKE